MGKKSSGKQQGGVSTVTMPLEKAKRIAAGSNSKKKGSKGK